MTELLPIASPYPDVAVEAIRKGYLHPRNRKLELICVRKALDRLVQGETGKMMEPEEAMAYLLQRVVMAKTLFGGRTKAHTPHLSTWVNQRRYLTVDKGVETPKNLEDAVSILECYPTVTTVDVDAHMSTLLVIDSLIDFTRATHGAAAVSYIRQRTMRYRECVSRWPSEEMQFVPSALKFFRERRFEQDDRHWERTPKAGYQSERSQLRDAI